jgi:hypothetical protein
MVFIRVLGIVARRAQKDKRHNRIMRLTPGAWLKSRSSLQWRPAPRKVDGYFAIITKIVADRVVVKAPVFIGGYLQRPGDPQGGLLEKAFPISIRR